MKFLLPFRLGSFLAVVLLGLTASIASAQEEGDDEPVDAAVYEAADPDQPQKAALVTPGPGATYRSDSLRGAFVGQPMFITILGKKHFFWGARAISLDPDSPLRTLSMRVRRGRPQKFTVGDVVSRLDGVTLDVGKFQDGNGVWQMPELEGHFGATDVRWIKQRHQSVNVGEILIDNVGTGVSPVTP